ncbi:hypothetical protein B0H15DRAFT_482057 [Mycena belliarum]|uniref:Uncharacterized protein n=1 Tax=Mycena belliarum TaxID=1033014 RepID=A0AAD6TWY7_9AGAR|nr:hypothetical protein B0H15DRAFT_482057 [Mycena belliae]
MDFLAFTSLQVVLLPKTNVGPLLLVPAYCTGISASILLLHYLVSLDVVIRARILSDGPPPPGIGNGVILSFRFVRLLGCLGLIGISFERKDVARSAMLGIPYLYAAILAFFTLNPPHARHRLVRHANVVLFSAFCVYAYRGLFPLATFTREPADLADGPNLWARIALLFVSGVAVPLLTPSQYIPVDPLHPMGTPNPEQTASIFSFTFYFFLDRIVFLAYREFQLKEHELYSLCDTDASTHLKSRSFKYLDSSGRHRFFGLMRVFHREFLTLACLLLFRVVANFSSPIAIDQLLQYIETRDEADVHSMRPWVWIVLIFLGPVIAILHFHQHANTRLD